MKATMSLIVMLTLLVCSSSPAGAYYGDKETESFLKAKEHVLAREWEEAQTRLEVYLERYPTGRFEEEALYWLARSLYQQSRASRRAEEVIRLKEQAIENLDDLLDRHPDSIWQDDAKTLKVEIAAALALLGREQYKSYIEEIVSTKDKKESYLVMIALEALAELEPEAALPLIEGVLNSEEDPAIRKQAVYVIGAYHGEDGLPLLRHVEASDPDEAVRQEAAFWRKQIQMESIPVQLNYFGYVANLESDGHLIPEGKLNVYDFPALRTHSKRKIEKEVEKFFDGKLSGVKFAASMTGDFDPQSTLRARGLKTRTSHNLRGFRVEVPRDSIEKDYFEVRAKASFFDTYRDREHLKDFVVNESQGQLMAMRAGDNVAILVLQFESLEEPLETSEEPVYHTKIENVLGATVHSSRQSWDMDEMLAMSKGSIVDYGRARVEIPGVKGKWVLIGDIQLHSKERRFVGRGAVLYDPKGDVVAKGPEIVVPADDPDGFEVIGKGEVKR